MPKKSKKFNANFILILATIYYPIKVLVFIGIGSITMACVEGVGKNCYLSWSEFFSIVSPAQVYLLGGFLLVLSRWTSLNNQSIHLAIIISFKIYIALILFTLIYMFIIAPLNPELLSYYSSPGAKLLRSILNIIPYILSLFLLCFVMYKSGKS